MRRREFIAALGSFAALPLSAQAQGPLQVAGFISARSPADAARYGAVFRAGTGPGPVGLVGAARFLDPFQRSKQITGLHLHTLLSRGGRAEA